MINDNPISEAEARMLPPLTLAYLGDCIFDLLVREMLVKSSHLPNGGLHAEAKKYVSAVGQATIAETIQPLLTPEEEAIYKRGRNSHAMPGRRIAPNDYHRATGLEALFGYLYLTGQNERLSGLFRKGTEIPAADGPYKEGPNDEEKSGQ